MSYYVKCVNEKFETPIGALLAVKEYKQQINQEFNNAEMVVNAQLKRWPEIKTLAEVQRNYDEVNSVLSQLLIVAAKNIDAESFQDPRWHRTDEMKESYQKWVNDVVGIAVRLVSSLTGAYDDDFDFDWNLEDLKDPINSMMVIAEDLIKFIQSDDVMIL